MCTFRYRINNFIMSIHCIVECTTVNDCGDHGMCNTTEHRCHCKDGYSGNTCETAPGKYIFLQHYHFSLTNIFRFILMSPTEIGMNL